MQLRQRLARGLVEAYPDEAAAVLETLPPEEAAALLALYRPRIAAAVLQWMTPGAGVRVLGILEAERAAAMLGEMPPDFAASFLRRLPEHLDAGGRARILEHMRPEQAQALSALLRFRDGTAGALMDPYVMTIPADITAGEAVRRVRDDPEHVHYHLYVIRRDRCLVGVLNVRELLLADPSERITDIMQTDVHRLPAYADVWAILDHPGWRLVHVLPVVDENGVILGAVRYRALRRLEAEAQGGGEPTGRETARALGGLFWTAVAGLAEALAGAAATSAAEGGARRGA